MKNTNWTKTLLENYRYITKVIPMMEKRVLVMGLSSGNIGGYNVEATCKLADNMINLICRKRLLNEIKLAIEKTLKDLPKSNAELLINHYLHNKSFTDIANENNITYGNVRTIYKESLKLASFKLLSLGYGVNKIDKIFESEKWLKDIYNRKEEKTKKATRRINHSSGFIDYDIKINQKSNSSFGAFVSA